MSMKIILRFILITTIYTSTGQNFFIDQRDSTQYEIVQIGDNVWLKDNLRFTTPASWCAEDPDSQACENGNYYYPTDLINVCPTGWQVPTWKDYKDAIEIIEDHYDLQIEYNMGNVPLYKDLNLEAEQIQGLTLLNDTVFFNLVTTGWIEGDKWSPQNQATMWVVHDFSNTPQPHIHIQTEQIIMHSHGHNVIDKPKKLRRFSVRCIKCETK